MTDKELLDSAIPAHDGILLQKDIQGSDHAITFLVVLMVLQVVGMAAIGCRAYVRIFMTKTFGIDDCLLMVGQVFNTVGAGLFWIVCRGGTGPSPDSLGNLEFLSIIFMIDLACYSSACVMVKSSIGYFFYRVAPHRWQKWMIVVPLSLLFTFFLIDFLVLTLRCGVPVHIDMVMTAKVGCLFATNAKTYHPLLYLNAITNSFCDCIFAFVPLHILFTATGMTRTSRLLTLVLSILALTGMIASVVRIPFFASGNWGLSIFRENSVALFLSVFETEIGIITISTATLKPLIHSIRPHGARSLDRSHVANDAEKPPTITDWKYVAAVQKMKEAASRGFARLGVLPDTLSGTLRTLTMATRANNGGRLDEEEGIFPAPWPASTFARRGSQRQGGIKIGTLLMVPTIDEVLMALDDDKKPTRSERGSS